MHTPHSIDPRYDAVVVGARCAGSAVAMLLARAGAKVLAVDRTTYGSDTMSTHALMRTGVLQLNRWGVLSAVMDEDTPAIHRTTFHYGQESISIAIKPEHQVEYLCAPRRTVLDRVLVDAARLAGADVQHGVALAALRKSPDDRIVGVTLKKDDDTFVEVGCDILIGADGRQSTVAKLVGAESYLEGASASGCAFGYLEGIADDGSHWYFVEGAAAGRIPTNNGQHCVFASVPSHQFARTFRSNIEQAFMSVLAANSAQLAADASGARLIGRLRGFAGLRSYMRQSFGPGWALVGDAGYFKDPLTAHGITDALRDAELLTHAILENRSSALAAYQQERDALSRALFEVTDSIASFRWNLDEVKELHARLSTSMRAECERMALLSTLGRLAA